MTIHFVDVKTKDVKCILKEDSIEVVVAGKNIIKGKLFASISVDDSVWCLENVRGKVTPQLNINLSKRRPTDENSHWVHIVPGEGLVGGKSNIHVIDPSNPNAMKDAIKMLAKAKTEPDPVE